MIDTDINLEGLLKETGARASVVVPPKRTSEAAGTELTGKQKMLLQPVKTRFGSVVYSLGNRFRV